MPILEHVLLLNFDEMKLENYLNNGKFYIWKGKFAIVKSRKPLPDSFAVIKDKNEITAIIGQSEINKNKKHIIKIDKNWKIITFDMILPFGLVGFLAKISKILADEKISIFVISAYSTDHILIKEKDSSKAINRSKSIGLKIK